MVKIVHMAQDEFEANLHRLDFRGIRYYAPPHWSSPHNSYEYIVATVGELVVGMVEFQRSPFNEDEMWLKYIETHPNYRNQRIATQMIELMAEWVGKYKPAKKIVVSRPSNDGLTYTQHKIYAALTSIGQAWECSE